MDLITALHLGEDREPLIRKLAAIEAATPGDLRRCVLISTELSALYLGVAGAHDLTTLRPPCASAA
jgi:hypothetical protein